MLPVMKNKYLSFRRASCGILVVALLVVLAGCGGSSGATNAPSPTSTSTLNVGAANDAPSPTSTQPGATPTSQPSPTATRTNPTPTRTIPTPIPTRATPTPMPKPNPSPTPKPPTPTPTPPPTTMNVAIITSSTFAFSPQTLSIAVGTIVVWKNNTGAPHTVTSDNGVFGSGTISPGGTFSFKFTQAGTFAYHCNIHPFMTATIIVK